MVGVLLSDNLEILAARAGIEPATKWLTATCSTAELPGNQRGWSMPPSSRLARESLKKITSRKAPVFTGFSQIIPEALIDMVMNFKITEVATASVGRGCHRARTGELLVGPEE